MEIYEKINKQTNKQNKKQKAKEERFGRREEIPPYLPSRQ